MDEVCGREDSDRGGVDGFVGSKQWAGEDEVRELSTCSIGIDVTNGGVGFTWRNCVSISLEFMECLYEGRGVGRITV